MKRKKRYRLFLYMILFELLIIIGIVGYATVKESLVSPRFKLPSLNEALNLDIKEKKEETAKEEEETTQNGEETSPPKKQEFISVDASYFDDALFIGDSRTVALRAFGSFQGAHFFAKTGISVNALFEYPASDEVTGLSLRHILSQRQYKKIYLMIGVNDLSYGTLFDFTDSYFKAVSTIREYQPSALIFVQSIVGITKQKERNSPHSFNNETVLNRNSMLKLRCEEENCIYLDLFSVFRDGENYLDTNLSSDGLHIKPDKTYIWEDFLKTHAIEIEE